MEKEHLGKCLVIYKYRYWADKPFELQYAFFDNAIAIEKWLNEKFEGKDLEEFPNNQNWEIIFMGYVESQYTATVKEKVKKIVVSV